MCKELSTEIIMRVFDKADQTSARNELEKALNKLKARKRSWIGWSVLECKTSSVGLERRMYSITN